MSNYFEERSEHAYSPYRDEDDRESLLTMDEVGNESRHPELHNVSQAIYLSRAHNSFNDTAQSGRRNFISSPTRLGFNSGLGELQRMIQQEFDRRESQSPQIFHRASASHSEPIESS